MTSEEFATDLLNKEHVVVVPGTAFGDSGEGFVRISYAYSLDALKEAIKRIERYLGGKWFFRPGPIIVYNYETLEYDEKRKQNNDKNY